ncbi:MAG: membrane protein insertion efficiency factor YidD [Rhizobiales bacterium]|nr:membrane protein insertion efficiency factor YidD [Hyphomicrobiales bacterium]
MKNILTMILGAIFRLPIFLYKYGISPFTSASCRHLPTCSEYADTSIKRFGGVKGGILAFSRLMRCHPFGSHGLDPVPDELPDQGIKFWKYGRWNGKHIEHGFYEDDS